MHVSVCFNKRRKVDQFTYVNLGAIVSGLLMKSLTRFYSQYKDYIQIEIFNEMNTHEDRIDEEK